VSVRYFARQLGLQTGLLVIPTIDEGTNGPVEGPPITVPLQGEGTLERSQTDIFDVPSDPTVDVLFVVDDSGSMSGVQNLMADNFSQFFTASNVQAADYHIAVTSTLMVSSSCIPDLSGNSNCPDHEMSGHWTACPGNDRFLTRTSVNPQSQFQCNVRVSQSMNPPRPNSDSAEASLRGAYNFLSAPKINDPAINGGFLRDVAKLHVIMVSDEPEQSRGPVDLYIDFFRNLKGFRNESLVTVSAIIPLPGESCGEGGTRYDDVVNAFNGRTQSLCQSDWTGTMANLGLDSIGLQTEFFLSRAAEGSTLSVCVRAGSSTAPCTAVPQTTDGSNNGYFYDPVTNSIVFNPASIPGRGSRVEVTYETFCF
jgi:hypothetical protein